jgi:L(+)-tartrate dehydratase alpha subunit
MPIDIHVVEKAAAELNLRAATVIPGDVRKALRELEAHESHQISRFVLSRINENVKVAKEERRPFCADTGLPRYYVKAGNEACVEGGFTAMEACLRRATADATRSIPLRPNRVHPLSRKDHNNNVGAHAPSVFYSFEPDADWIDLTVLHKGGLFGSDYRMLFPADGVPGIKRFFLDTLGQFFRRGLSCQPAIIGVGLGGSKDDCFRLGMEASCLRIIGSVNPDAEIARLERELLELGNAAGFGPMGFPGNSSVMAVNIEVAYAHTGGLPVSIHHLCFAARRATARVHADNRVEHREDPLWFTPYYRREGVQ